MNKSDGWKNSYGITLVEMLAALAIFGIIATLIISVCVSGMNSYKRVNSEILLHDEANYVMTQFENYIYVASKVEEITQSDCTSLIKVTNLDGDELKPRTTILGFDHHNAVINGSAIQSSPYQFSCGNPEDESKLSVEGHTVKIKMVIEDPQSDKVKNFELNNEISFESIE